MTSYDGPIEINTLFVENDLYTVASMFFPDMLN